MSSSQQHLCASSQTFAWVSPVPSLCLFLQFHGCNHPANLQTFFVNSLLCSASSCCQDVSLFPVLRPADGATLLGLSKDITNIQQMNLSDLTVLVQYCIEILDLTWREPVFNNESDFFFMKRWLDFIYSSLKKHLTHISLLKTQTNEYLSGALVALSCTMTHSSY